MESTPTEQQLSGNPTLKGYSHVGLGTMDMDGTIEFYNGVLQFPIRRYDRLIIEEGGTCRHIFFEVGRDQLLSFLGPEGVPGIGPDVDTSLYKTVIGVHFAFEAGTVSGLRARREQLVAHGIEVTDVIDHEWCNSIYFNDPVNGLRLEFCAMMRDFRPDDAALRDRETISIRAWRPITLEQRDEVLQRAQRSRFDVIDDEREPVGADFHP
jgi:catechol 2,3-dioxygenase-like lactoylglutathione lyase family enzyme